MAKKSILLKVSALSALPITARMGLSAFVCQSVLSLMSSYFQKKFRQSAACEMAWKIAAGERVAKSLCQNLAEQIMDLSDSAEEEGYSHDAIATGAHLVGEYVENNGVCCAYAIDCAAALLSERNLFVQGVGWPSTLKEQKYVTDKYLDQLQKPVYRLAKQTYQKVKELGNIAIQLSTFNGLELDTTCRQLPESSIKKIKSRPPIRETFRVTSEP